MAIFVNPSSLRIPFSIKILVKRVSSLCWSSYCWKEKYEPCTLYYYFLDKRRDFIRNKKEYNEGKGQGVLQKTTCGDRQSKKTNEALFPAHQSLCTSEIPTTLKALKLKPEVRQNMILNPKEKARDDTLYPLFRVCKEKIPLWVANEMKLQ